jgi:hypothetical protein
MTRIPLLAVVLLSATACLGTKGDAASPPTTVDLITETEQAVGLGTTVPPTTQAPTTTAAEAQSGQDYFDGLRGYLMSVGADEEVANCVALRATADYVKGLDPNDPERQKAYFELCGATP